MTFNWSDYRNEIIISANDSDVLSKPMKPPEQVRTDQRAYQEKKRQERKNKTAGKKG
jgi:hypothetical protein